MKGPLEFLTTRKEVPPLVVITAFFFLAFFYATSIRDSGTLLASVVNWLVATSPIWLPITLLVAAHKVWMKYVRTKRFLEIDNVVLEVRLPEEITQRPSSMESVLNAFFQTGEPQSFWEGFGQGRTRPESSLEIVSLEGQVHFFVRCRRKLKDIVEAHFYAHYPTVEIAEVPDYMDRFSFDLDRYDYFAIEEEKAQPHPFPIKTYVQFGLDKEEKDEFKHDPLTTFLETLASYGKGENGMIQIMIRAHEKDFREPGTFFAKEDWKGIAKRERQKIVDSLKVTSDESGFIQFQPPSDDQKERLEALGRNITKKPFQTGIRFLYIAEKDVFRSDIVASGATMFRSFESHNLNGLKPVFVTNFLYKWHTFFGTRLKAAKKHAFDEYRLRAYLSPIAHKGHWFVMSVEEIATLWHLPGRVAQTPTLPRIPSRRAEAPSNLPV